MENLSLYSQILLALFGILVASWLIYLMLRPLFPRA